MINLSQVIYALFDTKNNLEYPINLKIYHFVFNSLKDEIIKIQNQEHQKNPINQSNLRNYEIPYL